MQSRNTYSLVTLLLLTAFACARQEDGELEPDNGGDSTPDTGGTSSAGTAPKAGTTSVIGNAGSGTGGASGGGTALPPKGSGGKGGSKATGGTGGTASGGSSSEGGAGDPPDPVNMPVEGLTVTLNNPNGAANYLGGDFFVTNESTESFSLANIKLRYYFTNEFNSPPTFFWNWGQFGPINNQGGITCTGTVVEMPAPKPGANFYVEVSCPDGDFGSMTQLKASWKAGLDNAGSLDKSDDWSSVPDKVVVLDGNNIIWGTAP